MSNYSFSYLDESYLLDTSFSMWRMTDTLSLVDSFAFSIYISESLSLVDTIYTIWINIWTDFSYIVDTTVSIYTKLIESILSFVDSCLLIIGKDENLSISDGITYEVIEKIFPDGQETINKIDTFVFNPRLSIFQMVKQVFVETISKKSIPVGVDLPKVRVTSPEITIKRITPEFPVKVEEVKRVPSISYIKVPSPVPTVSSIPTKNMITSPFSLDRIRQGFKVDKFIDKVKSSRIKLGKRYV